MKRTRRKFSAEFKTKVVLEALSKRLTLTELAQKDQQDHEQEAEQLYKTISQLKVEVDFLKKNCSREIPDPKALNG